MMLPKVDKTLDFSSSLAILLIAFSTHVLWTCHMHKNTLDENYKPMFGVTNNFFTCDEMKVLLEDFFILGH